MKKKEDRKIKEFFFPEFDNMPISPNYSKSYDKSVGDRGATILLFTSKPESIRAKITNILRGEYIFSILAHGKYEAEGTKNAFLTTGSDAGSIKSNSSSAFVMKEIRKHRKETKDKSYLKIVREEETEHPSFKGLEKKVTIHIEEVLQIVKEHGYYYEPSYLDTIFHTMKNQTLFNIFSNSEVVELANCYGFGDNDDKQQMEKGSAADVVTALEEFFYHKTLSLTGFSREAITALKKHFDRSISDITKSKEGIFDSRTSYVSLQDNLSPHITYSFGSNKPTQCMLPDGITFQDEELNNKLSCEYYSKQNVENMTSSIFLILLMTTIFSRLCVSVPRKMLCGKWRRR